MMDDSLPDLSGKVISIYHTHKGDESGSILCSPEFKMQGGRLFLLGTPAPGTTINDWMADRTIAVAWDTIDAYFIFESLQDYLDRRARGWKQIEDKDGNLRFEPK